MQGKLPLPVGVGGIGPGRVRRRQKTPVQGERETGTADTGGLCRAREKATDVPSFLQVKGAFRTNVGHPPCRCPVGWLFFNRGTTARSRDPPYNGPSEEHLPLCLDIVRSSWRSDPPVAACLILLESQGNRWSKGEQNGIDGLNRRGGSKPPLHRRPGS